MKDLEWFAYYYNSNARKIEPFNIFKHGRFYNDVEKYLKKYKDKEEFAERLKSSLMYYFWCKAEWELVVEITKDNRIFLNPWVGCSEPDKARIDVTDDIDFDWRNFAELHINKQIYKNEAKIDVYNQVMNNWDAFVDYVYNSKIRRPRKKMD